MSVELFIGVDPGLQGAVAHIHDPPDPAAPASAGVAAMPLEPGLTEHRDEIDVRGLMRVLDELIHSRGLKRDQAVVALERVGPVRGAGAASSFTFGRSYEACVSVLKLSGIPFERVTPQSWQKLVLAGTGKGKSAAICYCKSRWPSVDLHDVPGRDDSAAGSRSKRVAHDGAADALCLAEWARRLHRRG